MSKREQSRGGPPRGLRQTVDPPPRGPELAFAPGPAAAAAPPPPPARLAVGSQPPTYAADRQTLAADTTPTQPLPRMDLLPPDFSDDLASTLFTTQQAFDVLDGLARAVFPAGAPDRTHMTWPETGAVATTVEPLDAAGRAEQRMRHAEARFRTLVEQIPAVTFMAVLGEGENEIYVSPHVEQLLGYTQHEWLADPFLWYQRLHVADRALWNDEFARGVRTGGPFRAECRFVARDGTIKWVHGEARIIKDDLGRPQYLQGVAFDITDAKRAQEVLMRQVATEARVAEQLDIARRVQTAILPRDFAVPRLSIAASMMPAEDVGGDYYDVLPVDGGAWLAIGDVSGHGLNAGLVMMMMQSAMAALTEAQPHAPPAVVLQQANAVMYDNIRGRLGFDDYLTFTLMRYTDDGRIIHVGAHLDLLIRRRGGGVDAVMTRGTWIGGRRDIRDTAREREVRLEPGDVLVLYTDGITEARGRGGEQYGLDRLQRRLASASATDPRAIHDHIMTDVRSFMTAQDDDMTLLVARYD